MNVSARFLEAEAVLAQFGWHLEKPETSPPGLELPGKICVEDPETAFRIETADGPSRYLMTVDKRAKFLIDCRERRIDVCDSQSDSAISKLIRDQVVPRILGHEGWFVPHAAAIQTARNTIFFFGRSGAGKSTLAQAFKLAGYEVIGDDAVIFTRQGADVRLATLREEITLRPDSAAAFLEYAPRTRTWSRSADNLLRRPALFFLSEVENQPEIELRTKRPSSALQAALASSFVLDPLSLRSMSKLKARVAEFTEPATAFDLSYPRDFARLQEVVGKITGTLDTAYQRETEYECA